MKTLQKNFTTPELSKRLLELGVPADSADCFYLKVPPVKDYVYVLTNNRTYTEQVNISEFTYRDFIPCWSVGRLLEIYLRCSDRECFSHNEITFDYDEPILDLVYELFVVAAGLNELDFSKLEE